MSIDLITEENYEAFLPYIPNEYIIKLSLPETIAVGMSHEGTAMGIILGSVYYDVLYLDWLFVGEEFRNRGIATSLIQTVVVHSRQRVQCVRAEFDPNNSDLRRLLRSCMFEISYEERPLYSATLGDFQNHFIFKYFRPDARNMQLCDVPQDILQAFSNEMERISAPVETPFNIANYNDQLSYLHIYKNKVCGCVLVEDVGKGLHISFVYIKRANVRALASLICLSAQLALESYPDSTPLTLASLTPEATAIIRKMFSNIKPLEMCIAVFSFP